MLVRIAVAIVLAVLVLVLVSLTRRAYRRWKPPYKPRRRDYDAQHIQARRILMARLKRVHRGLRFPTVQQKKEHQRFIKQLRHGLKLVQPRPTAL